MQWYLLLDAQAEPFLILLALLPAAAALACIPFLKHLPKRRYSGNSMAAAAAVASAEGLATRRTFFAASGLTVFIALYMAITVLLQSERPAIFLPLVPLAFTTMVLLLALYAALPATNRLLQDAASSSGAGSSATASAPLLGSEARGTSAYGSTGNLAEADEAGARASSASPPKGDESHYVGEAANGTLLQTLVRVDYWCIYSMYVINLAVGLTLSNNLESIAVAKGATTVAGYVAISSVATCLGTLVGAHVSEAALDAHIALARPWCLTPAFAIITSGCISVAAGGRGLLYLAVFLTMFGYGANLSILPATLHERYGQRHFGSIWAFSQTAMVVASSVFATGFAAHVYEKHATLGANGLQTCLVRLRAQFCPSSVLTRSLRRVTHAISRRLWGLLHLLWVAPALRAFSLLSLPTFTRKLLQRALLKSPGATSPRWACTPQRRRAQRRCDLLLNKPHADLLLIKPHAARAEALAAARPCSLPQPGGEAGSLCGRSA